MPLLIAFAAMSQANQLQQQMNQRTLILDGAMDTMIQSKKPITGASNY